MSVKQCVCEIVCAIVCEIVCMFVPGSHVYESGAYTRMHYKRREICKRREIYDRREIFIRRTFTRVLYERNVQGR